MIGKVMRGKGVGGLLRYLFGPGRCDEHLDPHLVAAWDDDPAHLEPSLLANGRRDVRRLSGLLEQPLAVAVRPSARPVWHCAVRTAPADRPLSDAEWREVARDIVGRTGLAPDGDDGACRGWRSGTPATTSSSRPEPLDSPHPAVGGEPAGPLSQG